MNADVFSKSGEIRPQSGSFDFCFFKKSLTNANFLNNLANEGCRGRPATEGTAGEPKVAIIRDVF